MQIEEGSRKFFVINWSESPLFEYFTKNKESLNLENNDHINPKTWDENLYKDSCVDSLLDEYKINNESLSN